MFAHPTPFSSWILLLAFLAIAPRLLADYPIVSHRYLADPGVMVHDGRVYVYCSNDDDNPTSGDYSMQSIVCVSSSDLKNWTDHGEVLRVPAGASWATHTWAPAAIERNGMFYLYFSNNASGIGVATSTSPTGPFTDAVGGSLINSSTPGVLPASNIWIFDPAVFFDDDGQAYLYFGGNGESNVRIIRLNEDMVSTSGSAIALTVPFFFEAAWMHKRNGIYYFSYSTNPANGLRIDYLTGDSPIGPFTYRGIVAGQPPSNNNNNHASNFKLNGNWYHLYHNRIVATNEGIPTVYRRNIAIERLLHNPDGTIQQVTYTTDGVLQDGYVNPYFRVEAETMNGQSGIETEPCSEGGMNVTSLEAGDWIRVRGVDFNSGGAGQFNARAASATGGTIEVRLDSPTGPLVGVCTVPNTGGDQTWNTASCPVTDATGLRELYFVFSGTGSNILNFNWWEFEPGAPPQITQQPRPLTVATGGRLSLTVKAGDGAPETYQWLKDGAPITGATNQSFEIADVSMGDAGEYTVEVSNAAGTTVSDAATITTVTTNNPGRLVSISTRSPVGTANDVQIGGFVITGTSPKEVLVRAAGPELEESFAIPGALADPVITLYDQGTGLVVQVNNDWDSALAATFASVSAFPWTEGSKDAALLTTLDPGGYTAVVSGADGGTGVAIVEVYETTGGPTGPRLTSISTRSLVGVDDDVQIGGFAIGGATALTVVIRAAGPVLDETFGLENALGNPVISLHDQLTGAVLATTDRWDESLAPHFQEVGAFPWIPGSRDAAVVTTLNPGSYTVVVSGNNGGTGVALVEVYELP